MANPNEKRLIQSRATGIQTPMTATEYASFRQTIDPQGDKFFDAGAATPTEAADDAPRLMPRTSPAGMPTIGTSTSTTTTTV